MSPPSVDPSYGKLLRVRAIGVVVDTTTRLITFWESVVRGRRRARLARELELSEEAEAKLTSLAEAAMGYRGDIDGHITESQSQGLSLEFEYAKRDFGSRGRMGGPPGDVITWIRSVTGVPPFEP